MVEEWESICLAFSFSLIVAQERLQKGHADAVSFSVLPRFNRSTVSFKSNEEILSSCRSG